MTKKPLIPATPSSGNVFADIGVPEPEEELAKAQLASRPREIVRRSRLRQVAAAAVMGIDQPAVTKGYRTFKEAEYVTALRAGDGSLVLAYLPSTGAQARTLTVDLTKLRAAVTARWFNPSDGQYTTISAAPFPATSSREFTTPGDNGTGARGPTIGCSS